MRKKSRKHQAGWNMFEMTWLMLVVCLIAIGISYGHQHLGGIGGALGGAVLGGVIGVIIAAILRFLAAAILRRIYGNKPPSSSG
jgi:hypothetical protein